jgi:nicotinamide mononucleotide transporter
MPVILSRASVLLQPMMETVAVILGLAYLVLAIRQNPWCWPAGIVSSTLYIVLMARATLYMESALQVFYVLMGLYGWWQWVGPGQRADGDGGPGLPVTRWSLRRQAPLMVLTAALTLGTGLALRQWTDAAAPFLDSFVTWGALVATWMTARKILETWHWWLVVDSLSLALYVSRELYQTAALFGVYLVLVVVAFCTWRRSLLTEATA